MFDVVDKILSKREVLRLLRITEYQFMRLRYDGVIKAYRYPHDQRCHFYRLSDLSAAIDQGQMTEVLGFGIHSAKRRVDDFKSYTPISFRK